VPSVRTTSGTCGKTKAERQKRKDKSRKTRADPSLRPASAQNAEDKGARDFARVDKPAGQGKRNDRYVSMRDEGNGAMSQKHEGANGKPLIVGIGGTTREVSSTDRALRVALEAAAEAGARTQMFSGPVLAQLPHYIPEGGQRTEAQRHLVNMVRQADGLIVASPGYHGGVSGLVKNALDLLEDLRDDERHYLDGRAVGCIATAAGWQAAVTTLEALRAIVHALRGWPTPFGATLNTSEPIFDAAGACTDQRVSDALRVVGRQVAEFARVHGRSV